MHVQRVSLEPVQPLANANITARYPLENAAWIWHPQPAYDQTAVVRFVNTITLDSATTTRLHVSGDQRYSLFVDGRRIGMGPDRSELWNWSFASYDVQLDAGEHTFEAVVWWFDDRIKPVAQVTHRGGFIFTAEGLEEQLATGKGKWRTVLAPGHAFAPSTLDGYHVIGPSETLDGNAVRIDEAPLVEPRIVRPAFIYAPDGYHTGIVETGWQLEPSPLPDMMFAPRQLGKVRAVIEGDDADRVPAEACESPAIAAWQKLFADGKALTVEANQAVYAIVDLENYYCGFGDLDVVGGAGSTVKLEWAEALFEHREGKRSSFKGHRGEVAGKHWIGFGDAVVNGGGTDGLHFTGLWWRSGRYLRLSVTTGDEAITLRRAGFVETRYPYENDGRWACDDAKLDAIIPVAVRGIQMCAYETYADCPYYEQMMYVGDTRLQMLTTYMMTDDTRLTRRGIELYDRSRWMTGFVAERCPSQPFQIAPTFSMIWVAMVHDYLMWRGNLAWARQRLVGIRSQFESFLPYRNADGLLERLPGWSFVDWVPQWTTGYPPDGLRGCSAINNLLFVYALQCAASIEQCAGEQVMADRYTAFANEVGKAIVDKFWDSKTNRLADDLAHEWFSEHSQCLAILTGILDGPQQAAALRAMEEDDDLVKATVYFSFYVLDALAKAGRGDAIVRRLDFWNTLREMDMKTPVEKPEPSRSDCHAWGSHPLFHMHASLAGIRPAAPGFGKVTIQPTPGPLRKIDSDIPHPRGRLRASLRFDDAGGCHAEIEMPADTPGSFIWGGKEHALGAGKKTVIDA